MNARNVFAADLGIERCSARSSQHTEHPRGLREDCSLGLNEAWAGLTENESPVERP